jgi:hypothetical protein
MIGTTAGRRTNQLNRYVALEAFIARTINLAHTADANFFQDLVMPHPLPGHNTGRPPRWKW